MLNSKTDIISDALDGGKLAREYKITKIDKEKGKEEIKEMKQNNTLNPKIDIVMKDNLFGSKKDKR